MQILLLLNQLKLETCSNRFILQRVIVLDVIYQLFEKITAIVDLE